MNYLAEFVSPTDTPKRQFCTKHGNMCFSQIWVESKGNPTAKRYNLTRQMIESQG